MKHYQITQGHLTHLTAISKRLFTERGLSGDEMRDMAQRLLAIVKYAEALGETEQD